MMEDGTIVNCNRSSVYTVHCTLCSLIGSGVDIYLAGVKAQALEKDGRIEAIVPSN